MQLAVAVVEGSERKFIFSNPIAGIAAQTLCNLSFVRPQHTVARPLAANSLLRLQAFEHRAQKSPKL